MASNEDGTKKTKAATVNAGLSKENKAKSAAASTRDAASEKSESKPKAKPAARKTTRKTTGSSRKTGAKSKTGTPVARKPAASKKTSSAKAAASRATATKPAPTEAPKTTEGPVTDQTPIPTLPGAEELVAAAGPMTQKMLDNLQMAEDLIRRLSTALAQRGAPNPAIEAPGPNFYAEAAQGWLRMLTEHPNRLIEQQVEFWAETVKHYAEAQAALATGRLQAPSQVPSSDRRFRNPLWTTHPYFSFIRRQYEITADALRRASDDLLFDDPTLRQRMDWFTNQFIDMMAPTNFLATNPDALERAIETEGESLVLGLQNLVDDIERHGGEIVVSLADRSAFELGKNVATAPGEVVLRRPLYELIQYSPTTEEVHATPIIIFPPWINKFYILDLKEENSFIRWVVDQGFTLFVMSWKNPDESYADTGFADYVEAYIDAMENVRILTDQKQVHPIGYCIGGTTLALTLTVLEKRGLKDTIAGATFFTTLTDFSDLGEFSPFIQEDFLNGLEVEINRTGILGASIMSRTFSFLRANDLVWAPAIRNYMMGENPPAFDLLFWNGDGTNLPGRMAIEYLRHLCQENHFATDGFEVLGKRAHLSDLTVPLCAIACETDHIAPWAQSWKGIAQMGSSDKTFIMTESGHIAGIVNPPSKKKYGHYLSDAGFEGTAEDWLKAGKRHDGSWWPSWREWVAPRLGPMIPARIPQDGLAPAPGEYVREQAVRD